MGRILVVDDDRDIRDVMSIALERVGHSVVAVGEGAAAVELCAREDFDLLVTDLDMPGLDGIQVTEMVRANGRTNIPILLVTGSASVGDIDRARHAGVDAYLGKPVGLGELRDRVSTLLGNPSDPIRSP